MRSPMLRALGASSICLGIAACGGSSDAAVTTPSANTSACGNALNLGVNQSAVLQCAGGTTVQLTGNGATYLIVPNLAAGSAPDTAVTYTLTVTGAAATAAAAAVGDRANARPVPGTVRLAAAPRAAQAHFDLALRARERRALRQGAWRVAATAAAPARSVAAATVPAAGSLRNFRVIASMDSTSTTTKSVTARLAYVGANVLLYIDTLAPASGFTAAQLNGFGQLFDNTLYPIDISTFGQPTDIDGNGHLIMLLSPAVNALTPTNECQTEGYVAGFFDGYDLVGTDSNSNRGELFYGIVPDPNGTVSCAHTVDALVASVPSTFLHELQHLISFSQHVLVHRGDSEAGWLDEGMSIVAEELGAVHYEQEFPPPTGRTNPAQLFPDSAEGFMTGVIEDSYAYLQRTDTSAVTLHSDADGGLTWRGGDWLLLRWLGDQFGSGFYRTLDQGSATGIANIEAASGTPFPTLFGSFSLALYTDSIPGVPRAAAPAADRFVSRNLRQLYQAYYRAAGPSPYVPTPFPFTPTPLTGSVTARLLPGSMAFYAVTASSAAPTLTLQFATPAGGALPSGLHPQLSVYRLQ